LALPPDHPVWAAKEEPLPVEEGDFVHTVAAPGWAVSGTRSDGIVRVANHGTDHANSGDLVGDSPLYAMIGYSTATAPFVDDAAYRQPLAQFAALADGDGVLTHRAGFEALGCGADGVVAWSASRQTAHWLEMPSTQTLHGSGYAGEATPAGQVTVLSLLRGPWECRLVRVDCLENHAVVSLRVSGWPHVVGGGAISLIEPVEGDSLLEAQRVGADSVTSVNPLGTPCSVPFLDFPAESGEWSASLLTLGKADQPATSCRAAIATSAGGWRISVAWPDGLATVTVIEDPGAGCTRAGQNR